MLFGEFNQQIDEKGRVRVPAKLKAELLDNATITKGTNGCLFLFPANANMQLIEKMLAVPVTDYEAQKAVRVFFSSASTLEEDNQGRTLLPKNLREFAQIKKDIVFIGVGNRAELWAKERYDAEILGNYDKTLAGLNKYGV